MNTVDLNTKVDAKNVVKPSIKQPPKVDAEFFIRSEIMKDAFKGTELVIKKVNVNSYRCNFYITEKDDARVIYVKRMYKSAYVTVNEQKDGSLTLKCYWD